jgi:hypothetical protein
VHERDAEVSAGGGAYHLGVVEVHGTVQRDDAFQGKSRRRTHEGARVPRVLNGVQHEQPKAPVLRPSAACPRACQVAEPQARLLADQDHPLRRLGVGERRQLGVIHIVEVDAGGPQRLFQRGASPELQRPRREHRKRYGRSGRQRFACPTNPFHDEESLALAALAVLQPHEELPPSLAQRHRGTRPLPHPRNP